MLGMVVLGSLLPARGQWAEALQVAAYLAVAGVFFLHGAKLSFQEIQAALTSFRPQLAILSSTYVVFPLLGYGLFELRGGRSDDPIGLGFLFLSILPSTIQSSISFTAIARGNVAAAVCGASVSNLAGVFLTPLLAALLIGSDGGVAAPAEAVKGIALQILLPFCLGQAGRRWLIGPLSRYPRTTRAFDRGSVLLVVYAAFSAGMLAGVWTRIRPADLVLVGVLSGVLLALVLGWTALVSRVLGFERGDRIAVVFCGSKKTMASGIPMANVLFAPHLVSVLVIPLMVFHQLQLMVCALLASRYADESTT
jgi:solute carrier family 10 (sodium/bile acid cotransporter), member 7